MELDSRFNVVQNIASAISGYERDGPASARDDWYYSNINYGDRYKHIYDYALNIYDISLNDYQVDQIYNFIESLDSLNNNDKYYAYCALKDEK